MAYRTSGRSFIALHLTLALVALVQSGQTLHHAIGALAEHRPFVLFGALQLVAAVLFLVPRTLRVGGAVLVVVFAHAALYEAVHGNFPAASLVYAVAALFVTSNGGAWRPRTVEPSTV